MARLLQVRCVHLNGRVDDASAHPGRGFQALDASKSTVGTSRGAGTGAVRCAVE